MSTINVTLRLLRNRQFGKFISASAISAVGIGMQFIALTLLLLETTESASSIGWLLVVHSIPGIVLAPWIGVLVDRFNHRYICILSSVIRAVALCSIPICYYFGDIPIWLIYGAELIAATCERLHVSTSQGMIQTILPKDKLLGGNSLWSMADQIGMLIGTAIGGILLSSFSYVVVIEVNIGLFLVSAVLTFVMGSIVSQKSSSQGESFLRNWIQGIFYMKSRPKLIGIAIIQMVAYMTLYVCNTLLPVFTERELQVGSVGFGYIEASWATGAIVGGALLSTMIKWMRVQLFSRLCLIIVACALILFLISTHLIQAMIAYLIMGLFLTNCRIHNDTRIQMQVANEFIGRVNSVILMTFSFISLGVYLGVGYLADHISIRYIYLAVSAMIFLGAVLPSIHIRRAKPSLQEKEWTS